MDRGARWATAHGVAELDTTDYPFKLFNRLLSVLSPVNGAMQGGDGR